MIIVSACLCGINCKYNGENNLNKNILKLFKEGKLIPLCPEQIGGLKTPRIPAEIIEGTGEDVLLGKARVINKLGEDCSKEYIKGAYEVLKIVKELDIKEVILKSKSPSCGFGQIYDGTFSSNLIEGNGVCAALLKQNGIKVYNESDI